MGDIFSEYIGIIAFLLFLLFPRIFRWIITRGGRAPSPIEKTLENILQGEVKVPDVVPAEVIAARRAEVGKLRKRTEKLLTEAQKLSSLCKIRGGAVGTLQVIVETGAVSPLSSLHKDLKRLDTRGAPPNDYEIKERRASVRKFKTVLGILDQMVNQRIQPAQSRLLGILDSAVKDCLMPYLAHAKRTGAPYTTRFALTVIEKAGQDLAAALESSAVAVALADPKVADVPRGWVNLVSDISMDVYYSTKGLSQKLMQSVGAMSPPISTPQNANTQAAVAGLLGAALPRIFGDVGAALYLGPDAATGLSATLGRGADEDRAVVWEIGRDIGAEVPMHLRMFAMCRALHYGGFSGDAEQIWASWQQRMGNPTQMTVKDPSGKKATVTTALLLQSISRTVDSIAAAPIAALGGRPLTKIPGLMCTVGDRARMKEISGPLTDGVPVNAPSRIIMGAALYAANKSVTTERRIGTAALKSMDGKGIAAPSLHSTDPDRFLSVHDAAASPAALRQAICLGTSLSGRRSF